MFFIRQNATHKVPIGPAVAVGDGFTPVTTLSLATADEAEAILHDNATVVDLSGYTMAAITTADGYYHLTLQTGITSTIGHLTVVINDDSLCLPVKAEFTVVEESVYDRMFASGAVGPLLAAEVNAEVDSSIETYHLDHLLAVAESDTPVDNSIFAKLASATGDWSTFSAVTDSLEAQQAEHDATQSAITGLNDPTAAAIADAVWDELQSGHVAGGSFGEIATEIADILVDTAEIGAAGAGLTEAGGTGDQFTALPQLADVHEFADRIYVDAAGNSGTTPGTNGTPSNPCPLADALTISASTGIKTLVLRSNITLAATLANFTVLSEGQAYSVVGGGQEVGGSTFVHVTLSGTFTSATTSHAHDCRITTATLPAGMEFSNCELQGVTITLGTSSYRFDRCSANSTTLDFGAAVANTGVRLLNCSGSWTVANLGASGTDTFEAHGRGTLTLAASCTGGTVVIRGDWGFTNNGTTSSITRGGTGLTEAGGTGDHLLAVPWNAAWDAEVQSEVNDGLVALGLDHLVAVADSDNVVDNSIIAKLASATADWSTFTSGTDSLEALQAEHDTTQTAIAGLNDITADNVWDEPFTEPVAMFAWGSATPRAIIATLGVLERNEINSDSDSVDVRNDADDTTLWSYPSSDDGSIFTSGEAV